MSPEAADPVVDVLSRSQKGGASYSEIASILATLDCMHLMVSQADSLRMLDDLDEQLAEKGIGNVTMRETSGPRILGARTDDGRLIPRVFTNGETLHEYAVSSGTIEHGTTYLSQTRPWGSGLFQLLAEGCAGVIFDEGTDHEASFDRTGLMRLVAELTLEGFAALEKLYAVAIGGSVFFQQADEADGTTGTWAFVYDDEQRARQGTSSLKAQNPDFVAVPVSPLDHFRGLLGSQMTRLVVNPSFPDERAYSRADVERMLDLLQRSGAGSAVDPALDPDAGAASNGTPSTQKPTPLWDAARQAPPPAMVERPGRDGDAARARLLEVKRLGDEGVDQPWQLSVELGFDLDVHALVFPQVLEGGRWPMLYQDQDQRTGREVKITHLFSNRERVEAELSRLPEEERASHALSCVEALRWVWACPQDIVEVFVDHPDPAGAISFPSHWAVPMLFPTFLSVPDLDRVPAVPLARLGGLPRVEGLEPRALRALVRGWQALLGPPAELAESYEPIPHGGGRYLPIYSDADAFFSWSSSSTGAPTPEGAGDAPRFAEWLVRARDCDGLVLDPGGVEPLTLDATDVFFLHLWSKYGEQPKGWQVAEELAALVRAGRLDTTVAGRIAADWPSYTVALTELDGSRALVMVPGTDDLAVFTDHQRYHDFVWTYQTAGKLAETNDTQVVSRWQQNVFRAAHEMFSGLWIDPVPLSDDAGLRLDGAGLDAALARLELRLRPRVPGFRA